MPVWFYQKYQFIIGKFLERRVKLLTAKFLIKKNWHAEDPEHLFDIFSYKWVYNYEKVSKFLMNQNKYQID